MKIAIMGGWNTDSGGSFHSESIGRQFIKSGHQLKVFTFYNYAFHGTQITGINEDYVIPSYTHFQFNPLKLDPRPFITNDYKYFIAEDVGMFPLDLLGKIFYTHIKKKAKAVSVFHDNNLSENPSYYQLDWDAIVCFDERYRDILLQAHPKKKIHMIPYPCVPWQPGNKDEARDLLSLPTDKKIIFTFGLNSFRVFDQIKNIKPLCKEYPITLLCLTKDMKTIKMYKELQKILSCDVIIREEAPSTNRLYKYLHASDVLLYYRKQVSFIVVASTILQCLGAGCPILGNSSRYTEMFNNEIMKYDSKKEMLENIRNIFDQTAAYKKMLISAEKYSKTHSDKKIAEKFIQLYKKI